MENDKVRDSDNLQFPSQNRRDGREELRGVRDSRTVSHALSSRRSETETAEGFSFVAGGPWHMSNLPNEDSISLSPPTSSIFSSSASGSSKDEKIGSATGRHPLNAGGASREVHASITSLESQGVSSVLVRGQLNTDDSRTSNSALGALEASAAHHFLVPSSLVHRAREPISKRTSAMRHFQEHYQPEKPSPSFLDSKHQGPLMAQNNVLIDDRTQVVLEETAAPAAAAFPVPHLSPAPATRTGPMDHFLLGLNTDRQSPETGGKIPGLYKDVPVGRSLSRWFRHELLENQTETRNPPFPPDIPVFGNSSLLGRKIPNTTGLNNRFPASDASVNKDRDFDKDEYENAMDVPDMGLANLPFARRRRRTDEEAQPSPQGGYRKTELDNNKKRRGSEHWSSSVVEDADGPEPPFQPSERSTGQTSKSLWDERYGELRHFKVEHGNCNVPFSYTENPLLAKWVKRQRYQYKCKMRGEHSHLTDDRQARLDEIGFVWDTHIAAWDEKFAEIEEFHRRYGHCEVPSRNKELKAWCKRQRRQYKHFLDAGGDIATMTTERVERLNTVNFRWQAIRPAVSKTSTDATTRETTTPETTSTQHSSRWMGSSRVSEHIDSSSQYSSSVGGASTEPDEKKKWDERP